MLHLIKKVMTASFLVAIAFSGAGKVSAQSVGDQAADAAAGVFALPNFEGDTREEDSHYNTLHQYPFPAWDTYRSLLYSYAAQARQYAAQGYPNTPYATYDYAAADMTSGPGGPVPSAVPGNPTYVSTGTGVTIGNGTATSSVSGNVVSPSTNMTNTSVPGLVGGI